MKTRAHPRLKQLATLLALATAILWWAARSQPSVAGVWQTADADMLAARPTMTLSRTGVFQFDATGRGRAQREVATARWELKDRAIWIIEGQKREKLAEVAAVTPTTLILALADIGVQKFTRVGDGD